MKRKDKEKLKHAISNIIWMARRYAHKRHTYAPALFNEAYDTIRAILFNDKTVPSDTNISEDMKHFPYASYTKAICPNEEELPDKEFRKYLNLKKVKNEKSL